MRVLSLPLLAGALVLGACASDEALAPGDGTSAPDARAASSQASRPKSGFEIQYMEFAVDHHTMGIMMIEMCLEMAFHEPLLELCRRNLEAQTRERELLLAWLQEWYGLAYQPQIPPGQLTTMEHLAELSEAEFEIEFMETFSRHHHQIIQRSSPVARQAAHEPLQELAATIVAAQSADIQAMLNWLCVWYDICHPRFGFNPTGG